MEAAIPSIFDWSSTAASNTSIDGIGTNTGMSPANVDNVFRSMAAIIRSTFASALQTFLAGSAALPIANGGTGAITAPLALTALNALDASYRDIVPVAKSSNFTFAASERGGGISASGTIAGTINPESSTPMNSGAVFVIRSAGTTTITRGAGVSLKVNGGTSSADATIAAGGIGTLIRWASDDWTISGPGVS